MINLNENNVETPLDSVSILETLTSIVAGPADYSGPLLAMMSNLGKDNSILLNFSKLLNRQANKTITEADFVKDYLGELKVSDFLIFIECQYFENIQNFKLMLNLMNSNVKINIVGHEYLGPAQVISKFTMSVNNDDGEFVEFVVFAYPPLTQFIDDYRCNTISISFNANTLFHYLMSEATD